MSVQDQTPSSTELPNDSIYDSVSDATATPPQSSTTLGKEVLDDPIFDSISHPVADANATPPPSSGARIPRVQRMVRETDEYQKYYVPKVVSIGPYHFGEWNLQYAEKLKPNFAMKLLGDNENLRHVYDKLGKPEMLQDLKSFYEEETWTDGFDDKEFAKMMLLDSCFILYFIIFGFYGFSEDCSELKSNEFFFVRRDLFLLENQIPYKVLNLVMKFVKEVEICSDLINDFIDHSCFVKRRRPIRKWRSILSFRGDDGDDEEPDHLLDAVHGKHSRKVETPTQKNINPFKFHGCNFRNVSELADVGIYFKPITNTQSMTHIEFVKGWLGLSAYVKLPPIAMSDYTKPMLLNLMAYENCLLSINDSWVTSYVYLLSYLIDDVEDVKLLRKAWVLENYLVSDKEVVVLFHEIGTDLVENSYEYLEAKYNIQKHYECWRNTLFSQLKNEYFKNPWAYFALLGALFALFLTAVQTYFTIWGPKSTCDDLCMFLKLNHHL